MTQIENENSRQELVPGLWIDRRFSNKPDGAGGFVNHYDKMVHYVRLLEDQARAIDPHVSARTGRQTKVAEADDVFRYSDTASVRSETVALSRRLALGRVAIVGLGGTGSYVLDLVAKTPVREIHLFDGDDFLQHNAFRAPGAASHDDFKTRITKVDYFARMYDSMRGGLVPHAMFIDGGTAHLLDCADFVFICVDRGPARKVIADHLIARRIAFVDAGMDVRQDEGGGALRALLRATVCTPDDSKHFARYAPTDEDTTEAVYSRNIQVADLNMLNAALAVVAWKKHCRFHADDFAPHQISFTVPTWSVGRAESRVKDQPR
jgi:hypothetical protein